MSRPRLRVFLIGLLIGAADAVPGVSGGTVALVAGIYDRLIAALSAIDHHLLARLVGADRPRSLDALATQLRGADVPFLIVLGLGVLVSIVTVTRIIAAGITLAPTPTFGIFAGLIAGSGWALRGELQLRPAPVGAVTVIACLAAVGVSVLSTRPLSDGLLIIFLSGVLAVSATILPGISGSLILLVLGQYTQLAGSLATVVDAVLLLRPLEGVRAAAVTVVIFLAGATVGLAIMVRIIARAIARNRSATASVLIALVIGATAAPVYRASAALGHRWDPIAVGVFGAVAVVGFLAVLLIDRTVGLQALSDG
jgi:putative membrane protein